MTRLDSRQDFVETWLFEMPSGLGSFETFDQIVYVIRDWISNGVEPIHVKDNLWKIFGRQVVLYWYQDGPDIVLGTELRNMPQGLVVSVTGKSPAYRGKPPFASDLYAAILDDNHMSLRLFSDTQLSDEGLTLWKNMLKRGFAVSVYDVKNPGKTFETLHTIQDLDKFFQHDNTDYTRYQYVLSKQGINLAETRSFFHLRRYRELSGLNLT